MRSHLEASRSIQEILLETLGEGQRQELRRALEPLPEAPGGVPVESLQDLLASLSCPRFAATGVETLPQELCEAAVAQRMFFPADELLSLCQEVDTAGIGSISLATFRRVMNTWASQSLIDSSECLEIVRNVPESRACFRGAHGLSDDELMEGLHEEPDEEQASCEGPGDFDSSGCSVMVAHGDATLRLACDARATTLGQLQRRLATETGLEPRAQRLLLDCELLPREPRRTLAELGLEDGARLTLVERPEVRCCYEAFARLLQELPRPPASAEELPAPPAEAPREEVSEPKTGRVNGVAAHKDAALSTSGEQRHAQHAVLVALAALCLLASFYLAT